MKTLIAVPCMDQVATGFCQSLTGLRRVGDCAAAFMTGSLVYDSRNKLAVQALEMEADYILWLDSDMVFNPDLMERLYEDIKTGKDFVSGLYFRRTSPFTPVLFSELKKDELCEQQMNWKGYDDYPKDEPFEIAGCGFGAVMHSTDMLFEMAETYQNWFLPINNCGEDIAFCVRARELGYKLWCDPKIKLGHVAHSIVTEQFYEMLKGREQNHEDKSPADFSRCRKSK